MRTFSGSYQGTPSGVPQRNRNMNGFSRRGAVGSEQGVKPFSSATFYGIAEAMPLYEPHFRRAAHTMQNARASLITKD